MIGISLICHGNMAEGMKDSIKLIIGEQENFTTLGLHEGNDFEEFKENVFKSIKEVHNGDGVIVFADLYGASPFNATSMNISKLKEEGINIKLITGVNLPMLLETFIQREVTENIDDLYKMALTGGKESIKELFEELGA